MELHQPLSTADITPPLSTDSNNSFKMEIPTTTITDHSQSITTECPLEEPSFPLLPPLAINSNSTNPIHVPIIKEFDPNADDDEDDDDSVDGAGVKKGRKKKTKRDEGEGDEGEEGGEKEKQRRKIEIEYIEKKEKRHITFSKRKAGK